MGKLSSSRRVPTTEEIEDAERDLELIAQAIRPTLAKASAWDWEKFVGWLAMLAEIAMRWYKLVTGKGNPETDGEKLALSALSILLDPNHPAECVGEAFEFAKLREERPVA